MGRIRKWNRVSVLVLGNVVYKGVLREMWRAGWRDVIVSDIPGINVNVVWRGVWLKTYFPLHLPLTFVTDKKKIIVLSSNLKNSCNTRVFLRYLKSWNLKILLKLKETIGFWICKLYILLFFPKIKSNCFSQHSKIVWQIYNNRLQNHTPFNLLPSHLVALRHFSLA